MKQSLLSKMIPCLPFETKEDAVQEQLEMEVRYKYTIWIFRKEIVYHIVFFFVFREPKESSAIEQGMKCPMHCSTVTIIIFFIIVCTITPLLLFKFYGKLIRL